MSPIVVLVLADGNEGWNVAVALKEASSQLCSGERYPCLLNKSRDLDEIRIGPDANRRLSRYEAFGAVGIVPSEFMRKIVESVHSVETAPSGKQDDLSNIFKAS